MHLLVEAAPSAKHGWPNCSIGQQENGNASYTMIRCLVDAVRDVDHEANV